MVDPDVLLNLGLFKSLAPQQRESLALSVEPVPFTPEQRIVVEGRPSDAFFVVRSGQVRVCRREPDGDTRLLNYLSAGEFFGEESMTPGQLRSATVEGVVAGELLRINAPQFIDLIADSPALHARIEAIARARANRTQRGLPDLEPGEVVLAFERKHRFTIIESIMPPVLAALLIGVGFAFLLTESLLDPQALLIVGAVIAGLLTIWLLLLIENWRNDHYVVTTKRVIQIERWYFVSDRRVEAAIEKVQTVSTNTPSLIGLLLGYKNLIIRTASDAGGIRFTAVDRAEELNRIILDARDKAVDRLSIGKTAEKREEIQKHLRRQLQGGSDVDGESEGVPVPDEEVFASPNPISAVFNYLVPRFEERRGGLVRWRRHPIVLLQKILPAVVVCMGAMLLTALAWTDAYLFQELADTGLVWLAIVVLDLVAMVWLFWRYEDWHNDYYELTSSQIVDRYSAPLGINETRNTGGFDAIQNVRVQRPNLVYVILDMGHVMVDTAAESPAFTFDSVFRPDRIREEIFRRQSAYKDRRAAHETAQRRGELANWFDAYDGLRGGT